ncbi:E3 SUMO-protein ligase SIZ1-like protein, partial [Tanacetum coccineum]
MGLEISGRRMKTAARFKKCTHILGFDLVALVDLNQRLRKWQCPHCEKNYTLEDIIIERWHLSDGSLCKLNAYMDCMPYGTTSADVRDTSSDTPDSQLGNPKG